MMDELPSSTLLRELRTGKLVPFGPVKSGIDKHRQDGRVFFSTLGLTDDEHDLTFHGGPDKAVHQYCSSHYPLWQKMYPEDDVAKRFVAGGFGENLVADGMDEQNVCIGDLVRIAPATHDASVNGEVGCLLEVSLPRQPCFKLNQRFGIKNFAPRTHQLARTGWYYRVKTEGWIAEGMEVRVVKRKHPRWTIERLHKYVHREKKDMAAVQELINIDELGAECKDVFIDRWRKYQEDLALKSAPRQKWRDFRIVRKDLETPSTVCLILEAVTSAREPERILPGSNATIKLPSGLKRAYSVVDGNTDRFTLGVARSSTSRGGSVYIHDSLRLGDIISVGAVSHNLALSSMASHHVFIAGGIGITAFLAMMTRLHTTNQTFDLHYAVRSKEEAAFYDEILLSTSEAKLYDRSQGARLSVHDTLSQRPWNSHIYVCGPQRMIDEVLERSAAIGIPDDEVHYEQFQADQSGDPFTVDVNAKGKTCSLRVDERQSLLDAIRDAGLEAGSSCEVGNCGSCRINVIKGNVEHRGTGLTAEEKKGEMLSCVSRGIGHIVVSLPDI